MIGGLQFFIVIILMFVFWCVCVRGRGFFFCFGFFFLTFGEQCKCELCNFLDLKKKESVSESVHKQATCTILKEKKQNKLLQAIYVTELHPLLLGVKSAGDAYLGSTPLSEFIQNDARLRSKQTLNFFSVWLNTRCVNKN